MKYVVGNWKMNQNLEGIKTFFIGLDKLKFDLKCEAWIAPQFIHIPILKDLAFTLGKVKIGAQTCAENDNGAFTGEVSPSALADMGVEFVILGHSERRTIFHESNSTINLKIKKALAHNLDVIFCVGETLAERESGQTFQVIKNQLSEGLKEIPFHSKLLIAYEPVWAIGTGKTATPDQAEEVHAFIRKEMQQLWGTSGSSTPILYGGSVKPANFAELLAKPNIDGGLVGGASLLVQDFTGLCLAASQNL